LNNLAESGPPWVTPRPALQDRVIRSNKEHGRVYLFNKSVDSLGQRCGGSKGFSESLHILVCFVVGNALEMLCPAIAKNRHSASLVWWQRGGLLVLLVAFLLKFPLKNTLKG
jgi:hypothetical protein